MPSTPRPISNALDYSTRRALSNALVSLNRRIEEGREFPNALESARLQWGLTDAEVTRLTAMYDAQGVA